MMESVAAVVPSTIVETPEETTKQKSLLERFKMMKNYSTEELMEISSFLKSPNNTITIDADDEDEDEIPPSQPRWIQSQKRLFQLEIEEKLKNEEENGVEHKIKQDDVKGKH